MVSDILQVKPHTCGSTALSTDILHCTAVLPVGSCRISNACSVPLLLATWLPL